MDTLTRPSPAHPITERERKPGRFYRPELDLLRFLAFFLVFCHHALEELDLDRGPFLGMVRSVCGSGLQIFFLLSAYLITELLIRERDQTGSIHLSAFFKRRMLRIWPLYFVFLTAVFVFQSRPSPALHGHAFVMFIFLAGNWYSYRNGWMVSPVGPLWSISVEEQFYVVWPLIARFTGRRGLIWGCMTAYLGAFITLVFLGSRQANWYQVWVNTFVEFQFFALGAGLALALHNNPRKPSTRTRLLFAAMGSGALFVAVHSFQFMSDRLPFSKLGPGEFLWGVGVVFIFLSFLGLSVSAKLEPLLFLGKISYGLYVFHKLALDLAMHIPYQVGAFSLPWKGIVCLRFAAALAMTLVMASFSYRYLEMPFLKLKERFAFIRTREA